MLQISYAFQQCKYFENRLRSDEVTDSLKVGTFLRHSVDQEQQQQQQLTRLR